tara:strand:+ start:361 stop:639 length:279 start_codon:yes stop_codon:yes gene_type:complete
MTETNNNNDWQERECGALWKQKGKSQNFLSGHVEVDNGLGEKQKVKLVVFSNKHKNADNHPDFRVYLSKERDAAAATTETASQASDSGDDLI